MHNKKRQYKTSLYVSINERYKSVRLSSALSSAIGGEGVDLFFDFDNGKFGLRAGLGFKLNKNNTFFSTIFVRLSGGTTRRIKVLYDKNEHLFVGNLCCVSSHLGSAPR